jgi:penicillin-binding protein 1C
MGASHRRQRLIAVLALVVVGLPAALLATAGLTPLPPEVLEPAEASVRVTDRAGHLLREVRAGDGKRARPLSLEEIGPVIAHAVIAAEDRRFYEHHGVDVRAVARAAFDDARHLRIVSGASTLTMQLARTLRPHRRNLWGKWREAALALRLEWSLPKARILEEYLNRVDFGPNLRGVGAASQAYFDKPPSALSLAEAALLAGLPRGPSLYAVTRRPDLAKRRRDRVLDRLAASGLASQADIATAKGEPIVVQKEAAGFGAPHLVQALVEGSLGKAQPGLEAALAARGVRGFVTTLEGPLQRAAEAATLAVLEPLAARHVTAGAVIVVENRTGDVLAYVGSPSYFDEARLGRNDGVRAARQPGSTLKPFLYALAMEKLGFTAATALPDTELHLALPGGGDYAPRDYDDKLRGPVRLRQALGNSLNVPAVWTADELGVEVLLQRLRELGFEGLTEGPSYYGPGLALGDGEVTLLELARAYATLARRGIDRPLRFVRAVDRVDERRAELAEGTETRIIPRAVADVITDVLRDPHARAASFDEAEALRFGFDVAAKTGTSKGFRDNWAAGYSSEVTVAAWVGNFDGSPMAEVSGITGAGPLFHAVMEAAMARREKGPLPIEGNGEGEGLQRVAVCPLSGGAASPACGEHVFEWLPPDAVRDLAPCDMHEEVAIDRRNRLRAGPGCPSEFVLRRVFERYGSDFDAWSRATNRPLAPEAWSPFCPAREGVEAAGEATGSLRITYPHDGARFVLDPERPRDLSAVPVLVAAPAGVRKVTVRVDGVVLAKLEPPFSTSWKLEPGEHTLSAESGTGASVVHVSVR